MVEAPADIRTDEASKVGLRKDDACRMLLEEMGKGSFWPYMLHMPIRNSGSADRSLARRAAGHTAVLK